MFSMDKYHQKTKVILCQLKYEREETNSESLNQTNLLGLLEIEKEHQLMVGAIEPVRKQKDKREQSINH